MVIKKKIPSHGETQWASAEEDCKFEASLGYILKKKMKSEK